ncbi:uncharacterized protein PFLUO_LOCUS1719 [Penicillium psychrofluorescens]|uniref:uncharacterized protein n=1 Tax=Penicillium psychrofluorescens TaxID=3158075 RepID=UPI003CCCE291
MSQFQLFPPPMPEVKLNKNPFRRPNLNKPVGVPPQIIEDTQGTKTTTNVGRSTPEPSRGPISPQTPESPGRRAKTQPQHDSPSTVSSSTRTATSAASPQSSQSSMSPVPIRSMFPQFDPKLALNQQQYCLQESKDAQPSRPARKPKKLTLNTTSDIDQFLGPKTVPASVLNFPTDDLESEEIRYSSTSELGILWQTANGQRPPELCGTFSLPMTKTDPATFTFGHSQQPFYTLQTYSTNEIALSRGDPSKPNRNVPIMMLSLEQRSRRDHPHDGLVALLFSRLAAMLAIEQAEEIGKEHHLSPTEAAKVEADALKSAAAQESCRLSWNRNSRLYELRHPSLSKRNPPALVGAAGIPLSPVRSQSSGLLHIAVSAPSSDAEPHQPPTIIVTGPVSSTAMEAAQQAANPRTSTLPVTDSDEPLAALDFGTKTLSICPAAVIATIPSLYAIDSLIAAMMAVAVSDEATNPILADMLIGSPSLHPGSSQHDSATRTMPFRGRLVTTIAEREDTEESLQLAEQIESAQTLRDPKKRGFFRFWGRSRSPAQKKKNQPVVEEFDLEKYGHYGPGSAREGEKLPGVTRSGLRVLFWGLQLVVKALTMVVKLLAWLLVNSTRCVTSEKF